MDSNRNYGCRITENLVLCGYKAIVMENELLRITILVDKGADIYEFLYKPNDIDFTWRSPLALSDTTEANPGNFLDRYVGGFNEILPNGGAACNYKGANLGQHDEIANLKFNYEIISNKVDEISVRLFVKGIVTPYYIQKIYTLKSKSAELLIGEVLENQSPEKMELMWGHHPTIGEPFLSEHCQIETSAKTLFTCNNNLDFENQRLNINSQYEWPTATDRNNNLIDISKMPKKFNNTADMLYLKDFGDKDAFYEIKNNEYNIGFGMKWDKNLFKYVWVWQVCNGSYGYPWYGRTYSLALEPWTSYPTLGLNKAIENGSALVLNGYEKIKTSLCYYVKNYKG